MTTLISTAILLFSLTNAGGAASVAPNGLQWRAEVPASSPDAIGNHLLGALWPSQEDPWERALQSVFVVPGPDVSPEALAQITEDMAVMCRILDKSLGPVANQGRASASLWMRSYASVAFGGYMSTQGLYLDGYGALFFVNADFPLVPPAQEETKAEATTPGDSVWSATVDELRGVTPDQGGQLRLQYDAQKVENLKSGVIKTLRHAANLRAGGSNTAVSVVIQSRTDPPGNAVMIGGIYDQYRPQSGVSSTGSRSEPTAVLILRTTKADVDAFASGNLTQEQFTSKVQVLKSWSGPEAGAIPYGVRSDFVVPSRVRR